LAINIETASRNPLQLVSDHHSQNLQESSTGGGFDRKYAGTSSRKKKMEDMIEYSEGWAYLGR
jgi:hypothetical protein